MMKWLKRLCVLGGLSVALLGGGLWWYSQAHLPDLVKKLATEKGSEALGGPVIIKSVVFESFYPTLAIGLSGVEFESPKYGVKAQIKSLKINSYHQSSIFSFNKIRMQTQVELIDPNITYKAPAGAAKGAQDQAKINGATGSSSLDFDTALELHIKGGRIEVFSAGQASGPINKKGSIQKKIGVRQGKGDAGQLGTQQASGLKVGRPATQVAGAAEPILIQGLAVDLKLPNLMGNASSLDLLVEANLKVMGLELPIKIHSPLIQYYNNIVRADTLTIGISGIEAQFKGWSGLQPLTHNWSSNFQMKDLAKIDLGKILKTKGPWTGSLGGQVKFTQAVNDTPQIKFKLNVNDVRGEVALTTKDLAATGPLQVDVQVAGSYYKQPKIDSFLVAGNFTNMGVQALPYFNKVARQPLVLKVSGNYSNHKLKLNKSLLQLGSWQIDAVGTVYDLPGKNSHLQLELPTRELKGLEKLFPILGAYPVKGKLGLKALLKGDLFKPKDLYVKLNPLKLTSVSGSMNLIDKQKGLEIVGPYRINLLANIEMNHLKPIRSAIDLSGDLSAMKLLFQPKGGGAPMIKSSQNPFKFHFLTKQRGEQILIKKGRLNSWLGNLNLTGNLNGIQRPKLALGLDLTGVQLAPLVPWVPQLAAYKLKGKVEANLKIKGRFDPTKDIGSNLIKLAGQITGQLAKATYDWPVPPVVKTPPKAINKNKTPAKPFGPVLPNWPLFRDSNVVVRLNLGRLMLVRSNKKNQQKLKTSVANIVANMSLKKGRFNMKAKVGKIFGGTVKIESLQTNLLSKNMQIKTKGKVQGLNLSQAVNWGMPTWKDLIGGTITAPFSLQAPLGGDLMSRLKVKGRLNLKRGQLNSAKLDQSINGLMAKIPSLKSSKLNSKGVSGDMKANYAIKSEKLLLKNFNIITPERNEFQGTGSIGFDKSVNMTGTLFLPEKVLADKKMRTCFSDGTGRVKIPLVVKGQLSNPSLGLAQGTLVKITSQLINCEKKRQLKKVKQKLNKQIKKQIMASPIGKELEKLGGEKAIKDKLKGLFN